MIFSMVWSMLLCLPVLTCLDIITCVDAFPPRSALIIPKNALRRAAATTTEGESTVETKPKRREGSSRPDLFPAKGSSYVPTGMTSEEYERIKKKEREALLKMNFGMWGPRFRQTDRPDGDWMVMPSLWTAGFNSKSSVQRTRRSDEDNEGEPPSSTLLITMARVIKLYLPAFMLAYIFMDSMISGWSMWQLSQMTRRSAFWTGMKWLMWTRRAKRTHQLWKVTVGVHAVKTMIAAVLSIPSQRLLERLNRKRLWSIKRAWTTSVLSLLAVLTGWAALLIRLRAIAL